MELYKSLLSLCAIGQARIENIKIIANQSHSFEYWGMEKTGTYEKLKFIVEHLEKRFPNGNSPFQIITRLAEECGELASAVNHFEDTGIKREKLGEPDPMELAKEVQDVMRCALQIARYYKIENELVASIEEHYEKALGAKN